MTPLPPEKPPTTQKNAPAPTPHTPPNKKSRLNPQKTTHPKSRKSKAANINYQRDNTFHQAAT